MGLANLSTVERAVVWYLISKRKRGWIKKTFQKETEKKQKWSDLGDFGLAGLDTLGELLQLRAYLAEGDRRLQLAVAPLQLVQLGGQVHAHHAHLPLQAVPEEPQHRKPLHTASHGRSHARHCDSEPALHSAPATRREARLFNPSRRWGRFIPRCRWGAHRSSEKRGPQIDGAWRISGPAPSSDGTVRNRRRICGLLLALFFC